uniref:Oxidative stress induced growth inhibitor 1 n=1 Tax=Falco tinnunculus TaxID=100819 RepID=A0A8C4TX79_FALTI
MLPDGKMYALLTRPQNKSGFKPLPVVIIGNGPSGICLSYLLSGNIPYFKRDCLHPHPILQRKLQEAPDVSILDQDLEYLSEGLEGRSHSPVALLFDALQRPDTDFGGTAESVLTWWHETNRAIPHLVLGRNAPGGAWHSIEGSMVTLSRGEWMGLPDLPFKDWLKQKRSGTGQVAVLLGVCPSQHPLGRRITVTMHLEQSLEKAWSSDFFAYCCCP